LEDNVQSFMSSIEKKKVIQMRFTIIVVATILCAVLAAPPGAAAFSNEEAKQMLNEMARSYYESNPDAYWKICSRFEKPQFKDLAEVRAWMKDRLVPSMTLVKVNATVIYGMAKITSEKLGKLVFRFDDKKDTPSRIIVATAKVERILEFDEDVPLEHRKIFENAYLKIYVTLVKEKLISYKSDEIHLEFAFMNQK